MAEQKKPSAFDGVTGKITPGPRGPAQSPVSPVTEALYQSREYDKRATTPDKDAWPRLQAQMEEDAALGLAHPDFHGTGDPLHRFDIGTAVDAGERIAAKYVAAGIPTDFVGYPSVYLLGLAEQAKEKLANGMVAPKYEAHVRRLAEYVPPVPSEYMEQAKKAGLPFAEPPPPRGKPSAVDKIHEAARWTAAEDVYRYPVDKNLETRAYREHTLPETQRALQRIAEATPPTKKK